MADCDACAAAERMRRVGVLWSDAAEDSEGQARLAAFVQALQQLSWTEGRNLRIDYRWAAGNAEQMQASAKELVAQQPDIIFCRQPNIVYPQFMTSVT
jgi:putative tryptophan/tyrosine transport system substrate-binding protein